MAQRRKPVTMAEVNKKGLANVVAELENQERNRTAIMSAQPNIPQTGSYRASQEAPKTKQVPKFVMKTMVPDTQSVKDSVDRITPENAQTSVSSTRKDPKEVKAVQGYEAEQKRRQEEDSILRADMAELDSWPERDRAALKTYIIERGREADPTSGFGFGTARANAAELFNKYGAKKIKELAESYGRWENERNAQEIAAAGASAAESGGFADTLGTIGANIATVGANIAGAVTGTAGYLNEMTRRTGRYATLDPNNEGNIFGTWAGAVRQKTAENMEQGATGKVGSTIYQGAMSAADSLTRALIAGPAGAATLAASDSFARNVSQASGQGASPMQAVTLGIANAGIEYLTEKIPLDNLFKAAKGGKKRAAAFIKGILTQGGLEAATEELSLLGSIAAEAAILGDKDSTRQRIGELVANGASYQDAKEQVNRELWAEAANTFAVSFAAGGLGAGAGQILGNLAGAQPESEQPVQQTVAAEKTPQQRLMETMAPIAQQAPQAAQTEQEARAAEATKAMLTGIIPGKTVEAESHQVTDMQKQSPEGGQPMAEQATQEGAAVPQLEYDLGIKGTGATDTEVNDAAKPEYSPGIKGTGAAEVGFTGLTDFYDLLGDDNAQPDRATDVRPMEMIRRDAQGRRVSDTAGNLYGAKVTSDEMADEIQKLAAIGALSFDRRSNREAMAAAAEEIKRKGIRATERGITNRAMNGKPREGDIEKGMILYAEYVRKGDIDSASEMAVDLATLGHRAGRDLQLFKLLRMMTPEGQMMTVQKGVQRAINNINRGRSKGNQIENVEISNELQTEYLEASRDILDPRRAASQYAVSKISEASTDLADKSATTAVSDYLGSFKEPDKRSNIATNNLVDRIGQRVADNLTRQAQEQNVSVEDVLYQDIMRFVNDKVNAGSGRRTEQTQENRNLRALADYHRYQPFFQNAWNSARSKVEAAMAQMPEGDPRVDIIEDFLATYSIENRDVIAGHEFGNASSTVRRAAKEAANMAGVRMENAGNRQTQTARREMIDVLKKNTAGKRAAADRIAAIAVERMGVEGYAAEQMAQDITDAFYADLAERSSREIQRILTPKVVTEKAKTSLAQKLGELYNIGAMDTDTQTRQAIFDTVFGEGSGIDVDTGLLEQYVNVAEQKQAEIEREIYLQIGSQIKATFMEKWNAWRYMAMLGNAKTQIRNLVGNAVFVPYKAAKDTMAVAAERILLKQDQRTKAVLNPAKENDRQLLDWAGKDAKSREVSDALKYSAKLGDDMTRNILDEGRQIFSTKALERVRKFVESVPQKGDMLFKNSHYANSLAGFLKARGYTVQQVQNGEVSAEVMTEARSYAIEEAMKATFNDSNAFSDFVSNLRYRGDNVFGKVLNIIGEGAMPFRRTPANILVRFTEYSPVGLAKGVWDAAAHLRNGDMSAAAVIDELAAGLTGSAAMVLGYFMAKGIAGFKLTGSNTDEDEKRQGHQDYALEFSWDGQEYSYKIDWAAPANLPLFVGANLYETMSGKGQDTSVSTFTNFLYNLGNMFEPMLALSCLSGVNDLFETARYAGEGEALYSVAADIATGYFTQGIPALLRQSAQASQAVKQSTFANSPDPLLRDLQREAANIPYLDRFVDVKTDAVNAWGEKEVEEDGFIRAFHAYLNPGTLKQIDSSDLEREVMRLNEAVPDSVSPKDTSKTITYTDKNGQRHQNRRLTEEEYQALATTQGQTAKEILQDAIESPVYAAMTDAQKAKVFEYAYDYAREKGRTEALEGYDGMSAWMRDIGGKEMKTILDKVTTAAISDAIGADDEGGLAEAYKAYSAMTGPQKANFLKDSEGRTADYLKAKNAGIQDGTFLELYKKHKEIDAAEAKPAQKAKDWALWLDKQQQSGKITREQKDVIRESMTFMQMFPADAGKYDAMVESGLEPQKAYDLGKLLEGIKPQEGYTNVRAVQQAQAIAGAQGLSDADMAAAMKLYLSDFQDKNLEDMMGIGFTPAQYAAAWAIYTEENDVGGKGTKQRIIRRLGEEFGSRYAYDIYGIFG